MRVVLNGDRALLDLSGPQPDVVVERYSLGHDTGLDAARRWDVPFVLEVNAPLVEEASRHRHGTVVSIDADVERRLMMRADLVTAVSEPLREWVTKRRGSSRGTAVLSNGCDPSHFALEARIAGRPTIAFLGHPKPWHGAERLVPLLVRAHDAGIAARLLVIGGGRGAGEVLDAAGAAGIAGSVTVTGAVSAGEATARLRAAWVGVAPYPRQDPFYFSPLKVLDYLAAGLPVVTTDQGDLGALVGNAGVLVSPDDDAALASAVIDLLADPVRCRTLGERGRSHVLNTHTWDDVAARWEGLVAPLVGRRQAPGRAVA